MNQTLTWKLGILGQGLLVVFFWSAAKIAIKFGLAEVSPFALAAIVQTFSALVLIARRKWASTKKTQFKPSYQELMIMIISGVVTFAGANLFIAVGLQYVTGSMAGLVATTTSIFGFLLALLFLGERVKWLQGVGVMIVLMGAYIFLAQDFLSGHWLGIGLLLVAEMAFAFGNVMARLISVSQPEDVSTTMSLVGNVVGASVLIPVAALTGQLGSLAGLPLWVWGMLAVIGIIYAWASVLWNQVLDKLRVIEVSVLANTMIVQVAILSVIFLGERLSSANIIGGIIVLIGALLVDGGIFSESEEPVVAVADSS
ncbi:MAG: DMT family transporter [Patescibacteria group bacterium]